MLRPTTQRAKAVRWKAKEEDNSGKKEGKESKVKRVDDIDMSQKK